MLTFRDGVDDASALEILPESVLLRLHCSACLLGWLLAVPLSSRGVHRSDLFSKLLTSRVSAADYRWIPGSILERANGVVRGPTRLSLVSSRLVCLARPKHPKKIEIPYRIPQFRKKVSREINGKEKGFECGLTTRVGVGDGMRQIPGARAWRKGPLVDEGLRNALQKQKPPNSPLSFDDSGSSKKARHHLVFFKPVNLKATHFVRTSKRCHPGKQPYTVQN